MSEKAADKPAPVTSYKNERDKLIILSYTDPKNKNVTCKLRCVPTKTVQLTDEQLGLISRNFLAKQMLDQLTEV